MGDYKYFDAWQKHKNLIDSLFRGQIPYAKEQHCKAFSSHTSFKPPSNGPGGIMGNPMFLALHHRSLGWRLLNPLPSMTSRRGIDDSPQYPRRVIPTESSQVSRCSEAPFPPCLQTTRSVDQSRPRNSPLPARVSGRARRGDIDKDAIQVSD